MSIHSIKYVRKEGTLHTGGIDQFVVIDCSKCVGYNLKDAIQWCAGKKVPCGKINLYRRYIPEYDKHPSFTNDGMDYIHVFGRIFY